LRPNHGQAPTTESLSESDQRVRARILRQLARQVKKGGAPHDAASDPI
jgi:hypothetical protein